MDKKMEKVASSVSNDANWTVESWKYHMTWSRDDEKKKSLQTGSI